MIIHQRTLAVVRIHGYIVGCLFHDSGNVRDFDGTFNSTKGEFVAATYSCGFRFFFFFFKETGNLLFTRCFG